jgi:hypothetical protein
MSKTAVISTEQVVTLIMQGVRASKSLLILFDEMFSVTKNLVPRLSLPFEFVVPAVA